jgi:D-alanyl-D-alanine carboxypeptidase
MMRLGALAVALCVAGTPAIAQDALPPEITQIIGGPKYAGATWGIRVTGLDDATPALAYGPDSLFFTGSTRKLFSVGMALNTLGPEHTFTTPVYRTGAVTGGVLDGDLVVVASGDLTLGGRTLPDGKVAFTSFDHCEANALGGATLTDPDPLAGIDKLAADVAAAGITEVRGDVAIDDRLFEHFRVPNGNVLITPVIVNDNFVDVTILPTEAGKPANVDWRPKSAAFTVKSEAMTVAAGEPSAIVLKVSESDPTVGIVSGNIPVDYKSPLPGVPNLVQTFTIADPSAYLRTVFIEALAKAGVKVGAPAVGPNPSAKLPAKGSYREGDKVAEFVSPGYGEYANLILKVSHNLGANMSLVQFGLTKGATTRDGALAAERATLTTAFGIPGDGFNFPTNGSGSPDSQATPQAMTTLLKEMQKTPVAKAYFDALPILGVDGSLASVGTDPPDPVIAPGIGHVFAKTGTTVDQTGLKAQVFAGYFDGKSGKRFVYVVYVNNVSPIEGIGDVIKVFGDEGKISAILHELF